ncbi:MAG: Tim44/TimA family putative adaptor protein [Pseudomonadota bacterium]|nr:Tim44/TimA family putative adaptor protein [Pseudomonadota bacterium]
MGSDFALLEIIFLAMLAGFLILRLRSVLGRRTGHEKPPERQRFERREASDNDNIIALSDRTDVAEGDAEAEVPSEGQTATDPLSAGLTAIQRADRDFDPDHFVEGARMAFTMIVKAFALGDLDTLKPLLSGSLYSDFAGAVQSRDDAGLHLDTAVSRIASARIVAAVMDGAEAEVTVAFESEQIKVTRDGDGTVVDGDPDRAETIHDVWTFRRDTGANDPNWQLIGTATPEADDA